MPQNDDKNPPWCRDVRNYIREDFRLRCVPVYEAARDGIREAVRLKKVAEYADVEKAKLKKKVSNIFKWMFVMLLGGALIGFFANQLDTILGCVCFILGIILLVGSTMLMSKQD